MRALISVSDKTGIDALGKELHARGIEIISTGGTAAALQQAGVLVTAVSDVTGFPEMLDGRVKSLHPAVHGGLLADLSNDTHRRQLDEAGIAPIGILVANLYPFEHTVTAQGITERDVVENIDIGGPAMVRAAAKNYAHVYVLTSPDDYPSLLDALDSLDDDHLALRRKLAARAFGHVSTYDSLVAAWLREDENDVFPDELSIGLRKVETPRYGENSHQAAAVYRRLHPGAPVPGLLDAEQLKGDTLSFNNYLDADAAWNVVQLFDRPTAAIIKHTVPCGLAVRDTLVDAYRAAFEGDTVSAFGGIVALNREVDEDTAREMRKIKLDIIIAPAYTADALDILGRKKATRILTLPNRQGPRRPELDVRPIVGGLLVQKPDQVDESAGNWTLVTRAEPTAAQIQDLEFAWKVIPAIKSNAILFVRDQAIVGLGAGQPNRLESVAIAARKAGEKARGAVMASDAFFPFPDGIEQAIAAGIIAVVQPGGSVNDEAVISAADDAGVSMFFTGTRHFRH